MFELLAFAVHCCLLPLLLLLSWTLLPLLRRLPTPRERLPKLTPVALPRSGPRGGLHRKFVQRGVTSEMTRLLAFETSNYRGGGLIDRPAGRFLGKLHRGRLPARCCPTSTRLMALLIGQLHRAPFDSHLLYQAENFVWFVLPMPFHIELTLDLDLILGAGASLPQTPCS